MASVKPIAINYAIFVNVFATNVVKTAKPYGWWYQNITRINPAQRNSDPACTSNAVVHTSSQ
jgi:hypothetical protein